MAPAARGQDSKEGRERGGVGPTRTRGSFMYRGEFRHNIENMMYAFGDVPHPDADSVALLEDMTVSFLVDICHRARPNPTKIAGIPSNSNTINTIAAGILSQDAEGSINSDATNALAPRRGGRARDSKIIPGSSTSNMPPRLAPHPYIARPNLTIDDLKFACRKDVKLSSRIEELIYLDKIITSARKTLQLNPTEEDLAVD